MTFFNETDIGRPSFLGGLVTTFKKIASSIDLAASSHARIRQAEYLHALSDEELAAKGLRRDEITRFVFRDVLFI